MEVITFLHEQSINRLLKVADLKERWDNDDNLDVWYNQAQDLMGRQQSLDLDTAMRIILKRNKEVLHKQLREALNDAEEWDESSPEDEDQHEVHESMSDLHRPVYLPLQAYQKRA